MGKDSSAIEILWPPARLSEKGWRQRIEDLAQRSEALIGRRQIGLQDSAAMALEMIALLWPALGPETIAASCRASLAVGYPGLLMAAAPFDQAAEIAARLDRIWEAAQVDPSVAVVELPAPLLKRVLPESHSGRPRRVLADQPIDVAEPAEPAPEDQPGDPQPITRAASAELDPWGFMDELSPPPPEPDPPATPAPDTTGWFSAADAAELLGLSMGAIARRRRIGQLGQQGVDWLPSGRSIAINPAFIEQLMGPPGTGVPEPNMISAEPSENDSQQLELVAETQS